MATPRKRWFRVADKIGRKAWTNDELAALVRLMAYLNGRWAREGIPHSEAGYAEVAITDLMAITGKRRADIARKSAEHLADIASISVAHHGDVTRIIWHNFPEFQEYGPLGRASPMPPPRHATRDTRPTQSRTPSGAPESDPQPEERTEGKRPRSPRRGREPPVWALRCAERMKVLLADVRGAPKRPDVRAWARWVARIPGAYGASEADVEAGIEWVLAPAQIENEYVPEVRSGRALHDKWPRIEAAAKRLEGRRQPTARETFDLVMARAAERAKGGAPH